MPRVNGSAALLHPVVRPPEQLHLFDAGIDLAALRAERDAFAAGRRAPATVRAYASAWRDFSRWCLQAGRDPLPASSDTVALYVVGLAQAGRLPATIGQRLSGIAVKHRAAGLRSPVDEAVREVVAGVRRKLGIAPRHAKAAVSVEQLRAMVAAIDGRGRRGVYTWSLPGGESRAVRDRAILLLGFAGGLRRSELAGLDLADVEIVPRGLVVRIRRSKGDQMGAGAEIGIHRGRRRVTCPARAVAAWLATRGAWSGPLFCRVTPSGAIGRARLSGGAIAAVVKVAAGRTGLDQERYAGHSLRAACATAAAEGGANSVVIMRRTRHKSLAMVERYVRHATLFACDPLRAVL